MSDIYLGGNDFGGISLGEDGLYTLDSNGASIEIAPDPELHKNTYICGEDDEQIDLFKEIEEMRLLKEFLKREGLLDQEKFDQFRDDYKKIKELN
jgi:hypothetical protein